MSIDFVHQIEIERPAPDVFAFIAGFENNPRWQGGMKACRWTSDEPFVEGATYTQEARFLGRKIETCFRVSEYEPGRRISIESTKSTFPIQVTRSVEPLGEGAAACAHTSAASRRACSSSSAAWSSATWRRTTRT